MARKTKLEKGFYPILMKDIRRWIGYAETWKYSEKEIGIYVAECVVDDLDIKYPTLKQKDNLFQEVREYVHDLLSGSKLKVEICLED